MGMEVKTVVKNVEIFAIDGVTDATMLTRAGDPKAVAAKAVQLLLTNEQNRLLTLAGDLSGGKLHLSLRGMNDDSEIDPKDVFDPTQADPQLAKDDKDRELSRIVIPVEQVEPVKATGKKWKIEIIAGKERRIDEVDLPEDEPVTRKSRQGT